MKNSEEIGINIGGLQDMVRPQFELAEFLDGSDVTICDRLDLGASEVVVSRSGTNECCVIVLDAAGSSVKIPVAYFDQYR